MKGKKLKLIDRRKPVKLITVPAMARSPVLTVLNYLDILGPNLHLYWMLRHVFPHDLSKMILFGSGRYWSIRLRTNDPHVTMDDAKDMERFLSMIRPYDTYWNDWKMNKAGHFVKI